MDPKVVTHSLFSLVGVRRVRMNCKKILAVGTKIKRPTRKNVFLPINVKEG